MGLIGARSCSGNSVVQAGWSETCDNHFVTHVLEDCGSSGCRDGECIPPFTCNMATQQISGLGLPSPQNWEAIYNLGNKQVDGICVNAWWTKNSNYTQRVEVLLNDQVVCSGQLSGDPNALITLSPPWSGANYLTGIPIDPNSNSYTSWQGNIKIRVYADGTIGQGYGLVRLEAISWRNA